GGGVRTGGTVVANPTSESVCTNGGEVSADHGLGGNSQFACGGSVDAIPIPAGIEESFVSTVIDLWDPDRPAHGKPKIVLYVMRDSSLDKNSSTIKARTRRVNTGGIEPAVFVNFKEVAVKLVRSGFKPIRGNTLGETIPGGEVCGQNIRFVDQLEGRIVDSLKTLGFGLRDHYAVEHDFVLKVDTAVNAMAKGATGDARDEEQVAVNLAVAAAANKGGYFLKDGALNDGSQIRLVRLESNGGRGHFHGRGFDAGAQD